MGTGTVTLLWYGLCLGFVALTAILAGGLVLYGQRAERRRRQQLKDPSEPGGGPATGD